MYNRKYAPKYKKKTVNAKSENKTTDINVTIVFDNDDFGKLYDIIDKLIVYSISAFEHYKNYSYRKRR